MQFKISKSVSVHSTGAMLFNNFSTPCTRASALNNPKQWNTTWCFSPSFQFIYTHFMIIKRFNKFHPYFFCVCPVLRFCTPEDVTFTCLLCIFCKVTGTSSLLWKTNIFWVERRTQSAIFRWSDLALVVEAEGLPWSKLLGTSRTPIWILRRRKPS